MFCNLPPINSHTKLSLVHHGLFGVLYQISSLLHGERRVDMFAVEESSPVVPVGNARLTGAIHVPATRAVPAM